MLDVALVLMVIAAVIFSALTGGTGAVSSAVLSGASDAVVTVIKMAGGICLWSGVLEVMSRSGLSERLSRLLRPVVRILYGKRLSSETAGLLSQNMSANLLGLGNAATPAGLAACERLKCEDPSAAKKLIVMNAAAFQIIPATVASLRTAMGAAEPYDILIPAWLAGAAMCAAGLLMFKVLGGK